MTQKMSTAGAIGERPALIVAGMHRSGTSAMARVLSLAGARMPDRLIGAAADNPLGFWEPRDVVALNDEILRSIRSNWDDAFSFQANRLAAAHADELLPRARSAIALNYPNAEMVVVKDPRVSILAPLWVEAMKAEGLAPAFIIMVRSPLEVAQSIAARSGAPIQASMMAWLSHMASVERDTRNMPRVFVSYDDLMDDWAGILARVSRHLSISFPVSSRQAKEISAFLSRSARHHISVDASWVGRVDIWPGVAKAWHWLKIAASGDLPLDEFPSDILSDLALLESQLGPMIRAKEERAAAREQQLQVVLAEREALILRLSAQAQEFRAAEAAMSEALAASLRDSSQASANLDHAIARAHYLEAQEAAARLTAKHAEEEIRAVQAELAAAQNAISDLTRDLALTARAAEEDLRLATSASEAALAIAADEAHERLSQARLASELAMSEAAAKYTLAIERAVNAELELQNLREKYQVMELAVTDAQAQALSLQALNETLTAEVVETSSHLEAVRKKLDIVMSSPSWNLTKPIRVFGKRYRALSKN